MYWLFIIFLLFCSGLVEVWAGNMNIVLPLIFPVAFYLFVVAGWRRILLPALVIAVMVDALWMRSFSVNSFCIVFLLFFAEYWRNYGDIYSITALTIAGLVIGVVTAVLQMLEVLFSPEAMAMGYFLRLVIWIVFMVVATPLLCWFIDGLAGVLGLRRLQRWHAAALRSGEDSIGNESDEE